MSVLISITNSTERPSCFQQGCLRVLKQSVHIFKLETIARTLSINNFQCVSNMQKAQEAAKASDSVHIQIIPAFLAFNFCIIYADLKVTNITKPDYRSFKLSKCKTERDGN